MGKKILLNPENQGRWWIEGDVIHIQDLSGLAPCPKEQIGAYQACAQRRTAWPWRRSVIRASPRIGQTSGTYIPGRAAGP